MQSDHMRKSLEARIKEMQKLQARLDDVEAAALKGDNKLIDAFESRIHEMEGELDSEQRRYEDANKKLSEHDRHVRELRRQVSLSYIVPLLPHLWLVEISEHSV
uniref:Myosin tail domain-containing protein n=1 Tax=Parascaris equorum TaxID=6256 RepID=A0A914SJU6_PAREQ